MNPPQKQNQKNPNKTNLKNNVQPLYLKACIEKLGEQYLFVALCLWRFLLTKHLEDLIQSDFKNIFLWRFLTKFPFNNL